MQTNKWSIAALDGLLLALITITATLIQTVFEPGTAVNWLLWLVKFVSSIGLLYYFIKDYSKSQELFTYKDGFHFGFMICLLSSLICACYLFLHYAIIFPDSIATAIEQAASILESSNPEGMDMLSRIGGKFPQILSVTSFVYYTLFGALASAIIANYTKKGDIFTE
ncbi:MAG: DUF4199 domain-containing protein [Bacteroidales bacterium]